MNPVLISLWCSSLLTQINQFKEPIPSDDSMYFRYILTNPLHVCDCAEDVFFCRLPVKSNFETFLRNLPCCFCLGLYIFHQRNMINPSWILYQIN